MRNVHSYQGGAVDRWEACAWHNKGYTSDMTVSVLGSVAMFQGSANECVRGQQSTKVRSVGRAGGSSGLRATSRR